LELKGCLNQLASSSNGFSYRSFSLVAQASAMHEHLIAPRPVRIASNPLLPYNNIRRSAPQHIRPIKLVSPLSPPDPISKQSLDFVDTIPEESSPRSSPVTPRYVTISVFYILAHSTEIFSLQAHLAHCQQKRWRSSYPY
jgi:hypothetical protein